MTRRAGATTTEEDEALVHELEEKLGARDADDVVNRSSGHPISEPPEPPLAAGDEKREKQEKKEKDEAGMFLRTSLTSAVRQPANFIWFLTLTYELPA